ncbi:MAG TPA: ribulose-phosphate 3-epimerase, partial [Longimicrobiales bacterium]|nr:ribulose-phosphate 3-epimerase [Longimicrobiales bacterium]
VDVMDGHFVPNISLGPAVARAVRKATHLPVDVHLMIQDPDRYLEAFADAGADLLTVHQETCPHLHRTVQRIRELGVRPGVTVNPGTPVETLSEIVPWVDLVLIMSVNPGFGGQSFIPESLAKIERTRRLLDAGGRDGVELEVDGGVSADNAADLARAGATVLVAGSAVFRDEGGAAGGIARLRRALGRND